MTAMDIGDLLHAELNEAAGTITRVRSKRQKRRGGSGSEGGKVKVTWKLWPITLDLLKRHRSRSKRHVFTSSDGAQIVYTKIDPVTHKGCDVDLIDKAYRSHCAKLKIAKAEVAGTNTPFMDPEHDGYSWESVHWGCKWGACETDLTVEDDERLYYEFNTAWSPPIPFVQSASAQFPSLTFFIEFDEPNMNIKGNATMRAGVIMARWLRPPMCQDDDELVIDAHAHEPERPTTGHQ
jgi:hypothetical protein